MTNQPGTVYLLHFEAPISEGHTTQHYVGWADDLDRRLACHRSGNGARLTEVAADRGIAFELARAWAGTRSDERKLKNQHNAPAFCPVCANGNRRDAGWMEEVEL